MSSKTYTSVNDFNTLLDQVCEITGFGKGKVFKPTRLALTGESSGPHISELCAFFGSKIIQERVATVLSN